MDIPQALLVIWIIIREVWRMYHACHSTSRETASLALVDKFVFYSPSGHFNLFVGVPRQGEVAGVATIGLKTKLTVLLGLTLYLSASISDVSFVLLSSDWQYRWIVVSSFPSPSRSSSPSHSTWFSIARSVIFIWKILCYWNKELFVSEPIPQESFYCLPQYVIV